MPADPDQIARLAQAIADIEEGSRLGRPSEFALDLEIDRMLGPVRQAALRFLAHRARSEQELRQRLTDKGFAQGLIEDLLSELRGNGLVDDEAFAREWVRQRRGQRGKSRGALRQELKAKGISSAIVEAVLADVDDGDEKTLARQVAHRQARRITQAPTSPAEHAKLLRRLVGALARRGFPQGLSLSIAREALEERINELH